MPVFGSLAALPLRAAKSIAAQGAKFLQKRSSDRAAAWVAQKNTFQTAANNVAQLNLRQAVAANPAVAVGVGTAAGVGAMTHKVLGGKSHSTFQQAPAQPMVMAPQAAPVSVESPESAIPATHFQGSIPG